MSVKMKNCAELPEGYREILQIDLQKDKKLAVLVNGIAGAIAAVMLLLGVKFGVSISSAFDMSQGLGMYFVRWIAMLAGMVLYLVLHELVHGICMKYFSGIKPHYGFTGMYAYAGSEAYFNKRSYIIIALAPIVVWGIVLLILNLLVPAEWFWIVYFIQVINISGAGGDLYVSARFAKLPKDILVNDTGVSMTVYAKEEAQ